jgi:hypothetical protein
LTILPLCNYPSSIWNRARKKQNDRKKHRERERERERACGFFTLEECFSSLTISWIWLTTLIILFWLSPSATTIVIPDQLRRQRWAYPKSDRFYTGWFWFRFVFFFLDRFWFQFYFCSWICISIWFLFTIFYFISFWFHYTLIVVISFQLIDYGRCMNLINVSCFYSWFPMVESFSGYIAGLLLNHCFFF